MKQQQRCSWCGDDPTYMRYHDTEWGVPLYDDRRLFEMLILEGAQAGLSWITVLRKRPHYRKVFDRFSPSKIAAYDTRKINSLLNDPGIIRNRLKVEGTVRNARAYLELKAQQGTFADFLWQFVDGRPQQNQWPSLQHIPAQTPASVAMSKALKRRGFTFVGPTICYAFMQATGMVNDHTLDCFRHAQLRRGG
ncbi:MAG: DNA-3-methyladenine glycosylase I [Gammaproteobacteria bacterium]